MPDKLHRVGYRDEDNPNGFGTEEVRRFIKRINRDLDRRRYELDGNLQPGMDPIADKFISLLGELHDYMREEETRREITGSRPEATVVVPVPSEERRNHAYSWKFWERG